MICCDRPFEAPENERICANVVAPTMMKRIIAEIATVPFSDANRIAVVPTNFIFGSFCGSTYIW